MEYLGLLVAAALLVVAILSTPLPAILARAVGHAVCQVTAISGCTVSDPATKPAAPAAPARPLDLNPTQWAGADPSATPAADGSMRLASAPLACSPATKRDPSSLCYDGSPPPGYSEQCASERYAPPGLGLPTSRCQQRFDTEHPAPCSSADARHNPASGCYSPTAPPGYHQQCRFETHLPPGLIGVPQTPCQRRFDTERAGGHVLNDLADAPGVLGVFGQIVPNTQHPSSPLSLIPAGGAVLDGVRGLKAGVHALGRGGKAAGKALRGTRLVRAVVERSAAWRAAARTDTHALTRQVESEAELRARQATRGGDPPPRPQGRVRKPRRGAGPPHRPVLS